MIFAAGFGTRMGALTSSRPKPLLELAGQTLLERAIGLGHSAGVKRAVVNAHYHADQIEAAAARKGVLVSREDPRILDTGGGLRKALPLLGRQIVFTLNPDAMFFGPNPLDVLRTGWPGVETGALLLLVPAERAEMRAGGGDFGIEEGGRLTRGGPLVYTGAQILDTRILHEIDDAVFSLNACWDMLAARGRLHGLVYPGRWCDVGTPEALAHAESLLAGDHG